MLSVTIAPAYRLRGVQLQIVQSVTAASILEPIYTWHQLSLHLPLRMFVSVMTSHIDTLITECFWHGWTLRQRWDWQAPFHGQALDQQTLWLRGTIQQKQHFYYFIHFLNLEKSQPYSFGHQQRSCKTLWIIAERRTTADSFVAPRLSQARPVMIGPVSK